MADALTFSRSFSDSVGRNPVFGSDSKIDEGVRVDCVDVSLELFRVKDGNGMYESVLFNAGAQYFWSDIWHGSVN